MLFIVMNSSLLVSNIVWGEGVPISVMSLLIVSKIACQRIFMLSDSGVLRTFVVDCSYSLTFVAPDLEKLIFEVRVQSLLT